jgi:hypothetical protein
LLGIVVNKESEEVSTPILRNGFQVAQDQKITPNVAQLKEDLESIFGGAAEFISTNY